MDPRFNGFSDSVNNIEFEDGSFYPIFSDPQSSWDNELDPFSSLLQSSSFGSEIDSPDDNLSNPVLKYLNQILLEENIEDRPSMFHDSLALRATEKSLYDVLGKNYPSSPYSDNNPDSVFRFSSENQVDSLSGLLYDDLIPNVYDDKESILQFRKGFEEASKFLISSNMDSFSNPRIEKLDNDEVKDDCLESTLDVSRGTKHLHWEEEEVEDQRSSKQSAIHVEEEVEISELLDQIFLCNDPNMVLNCSNIDNRVINGRNRDRRKRDNKSEAIDLNTLLISCAQSIAANDRRTANELLKKIRENSSTSGDACQRVAHVFANGLEARLTGLYEPVKSKKKPSAAEMLRAFQVYLSASPFKLIPIFFANKMVAELGSKSEAIHIVDFGIRYGFQWPMLIQHLSALPGGPPRLRITGIDYPQPGFRPVEQVQQTGNRLAKYCKRFHVPFEYHAIAKQNWEEINVQDLNLKKNEVLVVNSLFRFKNLPDETDGEDSPRDSVLKLIRSMNPNLFVNSVINGSYSSPFFVTRFREALYHYSALFDMFDSTIAREDEQRLKFEQEFYGREVLNVVSCEGTDRVERPEVYKQWQIRHIRAGLKALPLDKEIMNKLKGKVKKGYHKDFVFDEDGCWMLQGWKGRIICASSCWVPS